MNRQLNISISDSIFYRLWRTAPSSGFPDRSFAVIAVIQVAWIMLPILTLGNLPICRIVPAISPYYPDAVLWPSLPLFIVLLAYDIKRYNEEHYLRLHKTITGMSFHKWKSLRYRTIRAIWLSMAAIIADSMLVIRLYNLTGY